jgi:hypothetical protein
LSVAYWFSAFLLVDQRVSFLDALAGARAMVTPHWFDVAVLLLVIFPEIALWLPRLLT